MDKIVDKFTRRETLIYLAAIMDGEGSSFIGKRKPRRGRTGFEYRPTLSVQMVDSEPVRLFQEIFGSIVSINKPELPDKALYRWRVHGQHAVSVATQLVPFSRNNRKKEALYCVINFGKTLPQHCNGYRGIPPDIMQYRELLWKRCRALNAIGSDAGNQSEADLIAIKVYKLDTSQLSFLDESL